MEVARKEAEARGEMPMPVGPQWLGIFVAHMSDKGRLTCRQQQQQQQQLTTSQMEMESRRGGEGRGRAASGRSSRAAGRRCACRWESCQAVSVADRGRPPRRAAARGMRACGQNMSAASSAVVVDHVHVVVLVPGLCCAFVLIHIKMHDEPMNEATLGRRR